MSGSPTILDRLSGRIEPHALLPLVTALPFAAAVTYALAWEWQPDYAVPRTFMWVTIAAQTVGAAVALTWAVRASSTSATKNTEGLA